MLGLLNAMQAAGTARGEERKGPRDARRPAHRPARERHGRLDPGGQPMKQCLRRLLTVGVAFATAGILLTAAAFATSGAHFFNVSSSVNDNGALVVSYDEAGVGNATVDYTIHIDTASAVYACINGGGNHPKAANKETVSGALTVGFSSRARPRRRSGRSRWARSPARPGRRWCSPRSPTRASRSPTRPTTSPPPSPTPAGPSSTCGNRLAEWTARVSPTPHHWHTRRQAATRRGPTGPRWCCIPHLGPCP